MKEYFTGQPLLLLKVMLINRFGRQYRAAKHFGVPECTLSLYLGGRKPLPESLVVRLERTLGCDRDTFLASQLAGAKK